MKLKQLIRPALFTLLMLVLIGSAFGCEGYGFPTATPTTAPQQPAETTVNIVTKDAATLALYDHLLAEAGTFEAKRYLADFYAVSDNWSAVGDYFKDGSGVWYIQVDMSNVENWTAEEHWQQASWFVLRNGTIIPSNHFDANAIRIEADLQELSREETAQ